MQKFETWLETDLTQPVIVQRLEGNLFSGDNGGNLIGVSVTNGEQPATLEGQCYGYFIRDDGFTVVIDGAVADNTAYVILPASCYVVVGQFSLVIKVGTVAIGAVTGTVYRTTTDAVVDPGEVVPSIQELLAVIESECFLINTGTITAFPKIIEDSRIDASCIVLDEIPDENVDLGYRTETGRIILYGSLPAGQSLTNKRLKLHRCAGMDNEPLAVTLRLVTSSGENGNYLVADTTHLVPTTQYSWRLYSRNGGTDTYLYGIGTTPHYPTHSRWFSERERSLVDGTTYVVKVAPTVGRTPEAVSNAVVFVAALTGEEVSNNG